MRLFSRYYAAQAVASTAEECGVPTKSQQQRLPKPQLRNTLATATKKHAIICFAVAITACLSYRYFIGEPRKKKYAEFWRTFDSHADFKRMVKAGVFENITMADFDEYEQDLLKKLKERKG
ncbi:cytochrome c oxidase subunit 6C-like [Paramacrobiotus metropolitanus]|uniref:cytochrome c oxidase subunit 6C-like n=1 Tax=Paramacrobiotus metropolitanus TaxID=2943436 RepID=UPI002445AD1D|nr:cytochrome c oxidase subunit 6C-like [Paramacrobiotus metropolitanus]